MTNTLTAHAPAVQPDTPHADPNVVQPALRVHVVDDDQDVRSGLSLLLETEGYPVRCHASAQDFLDATSGQLADLAGCLILDIRMPGMDGLALQERLIAGACPLPIIFLTGHGEMPDAITAMRGGALDFLTKPVNGAELLDRVALAWQTETARLHILALRQAELAGLARLSDRELEVLGLAVQGRNNPEIAQLLGLSPRTIEAHRSRLLLKLNAPSVQVWLRRCETANYASADMLACITRQLGSPMPDSPPIQ